MIARLAILVVVALATGAWFTIGPGAGPPTGVCGSVAAGPTASAEPGSAGLPTGVRWDVVTLPDGNGRDFHDVVEFRGRFVAVGGAVRGPEGHAFVMRSTDGLAWEGRPDDEIRFRAARMSDLVVVADRLFGLGSVSTNDRGGSRAAVWISEDGTSWREADGPFDDASVSSLTAGEDGMLLIGASNDDGVIRAWRSESGEVWEAVSLDLPVPAGTAHFDSTAVVGDGWLSIGSISRGPNSPAAPVAWRSADGVAWTCHLLDAARWPVARAHHLHRSGAAWLAIGQAGEVCGFGGSCPGYPVAWLSHDGVRWSAAILHREPISHGGTAYAASDLGFVAVSDQTTWVSAGGEAWSRTSDDGTGAALEGQADMLVLMDDGRMVAAGTGWIALGELSR